MKRFLLLSMMMFTMCVYAQEQTVKDSLRTRRERRTVDVGPSFPGGKEILKKYLELNTHYPKDAKDAGIVGRVIVGFFVEPDGSIDGITVLKSAHPSLDGEAVRVISAMPRWTPGMANGKPVKVRTKLPITFGNINAKKDSVSADSLQENEGKSTLKPEKEPSFPGGKEALTRYLNENLRYPADAHNSGIQGKVIVAFVIEKDGNISNPQIEKPIHPSLNEEAMRVVKEMPRWEPGMHKGKPISVKYHLPITFKLKINPVMKPMSRPGVNRNVFKK